MKYTAINIGPILDTFAMAKKPRELWNASYMFSYLMECIIDELSDCNIISPAVLDWSKPVYYEVGLYPDRIFIEGDIKAKEVINKALEKFKKTTDIGNDYVNVMSVSVDYDKPSGAIKELNRLLDCLELYKRPVKDNSLRNVASLLYGKNKMKLYTHAASKSEFSILSLAEIATYRLKSIDLGNWLNICGMLKHDDTETEADEDVFYKEIKKQFKTEYKSYYKYICIVQADGDNMGKIVSALDTIKIKSLSKSLLDYGSQACEAIKKYGGFPIYAGGDDLLFIAPVISSTGTKEMITIFDLLSTIDNLYQQVDTKVEDLGRPLGLHTSISYGLSISYYKYPLYEALKSARELLFDKAKNVEGKNAIAWCLRKHSGSGFVGSLCKNSNVYTSFSKLMRTSVDESTVSAIAHKLRENQDLLNIVRHSNQEDRIKAFYNKIMEENPLDDKSYKGITRNLLWKLLELEKSKPEDKAKSTKEILETLYGMLRTAKFINGEGDSDE
jgi:CRISPR-associated protein Cmr2